MAEVASVTPRGRRWNALVILELIIIEPFLHGLEGPGEPEAPWAGSGYGSSTQGPARTAGRDDARGSRRARRRGPAVRSQGHQANLIGESSHVRRMGCWRTGPASTPLACRPGSVLDRD